MELCFILKEKKIVIFDTETVEEKDGKIQSAGGVCFESCSQNSFSFLLSHTKFFRHPYSSSEVQDSPFHVHLSAGLRL